jgi:hypothetical protein
MVGSASALGLVRRHYRLEELFVPHVVELARPLIMVDAVPSEFCRLIETRPLNVEGRYDLIENWSLTNWQQHSGKTGDPLVKDAWNCWLLSAESHLTRQLLRAMWGWIEALAVSTPASETAEAH